MSKEDLNKDYEIICEECSETFLSKDENEIYCPDCWAKKIEENEGC